jgi:predicted RNA-binding Zn-ribbon protein involved in translation (DUF1610 family)
VSDRPEGFYWVKTKGGYRPSEWIVCEFADGCWWETGYECGTRESEYEAIGPRIEPPEEVKIMTDLSYCPMCCSTNVRPREQDNLWECPDCDWVGSWVFLTISLVGGMVAGYLGAKGFRGLAYVALITVWIADIVFIVLQIED